jgi:hypothetical protein
MKTPFLVKIRKTLCEFAEVEIVAESAELAEEMALDMDHSTLHWEFDDEEIDATAEQQDQEPE